MILSCLMTANSLEAIAAPEMVARIKNRRRAEELATVDFLNLGREYASGAITG